MTPQTKILSFDEAKRAAAASRRHASAADFASDQRAARGAHARVEASQRKSGAARCSAERYCGGEAGRANWDSATPRAASMRTPQASQFDSRRSAHEKSRRASCAEVDESFRGESREPAEEAPRKNKPSKLSQFKRKLAKSKAERAFNKRYGGERSGASGGAGDAAQPGSRAAVYKGEMGSSHRRAARMQNAGSADPSRKRSALSVPQFFRSPKLVASAAVVACLAFACVFLYPSARQYYLSVRECDRLQAEYDAIDQRNAAIQSEVSALETDEGVADRARKELGWVKSDEHAVTVRGLEEKEDDSTFTANIVAGSTEAPETWYSVWLDPLFGVE